MSRGMPRCRSLRWCNLAALGILLLRSLVPPGFMLSAHHGQLAITPCFFETTAGAHHAHHAHHGDHAPRPGLHPDPTCPYAQSSGPAPLPTAPLLAGAPPVRRFVELPPIISLYATPGPPREHRPRGPPALV